MKVVLASKNKHKLAKRNENADLHMNGRSHFLHNSLRNNPNVQQLTNE